MRDGARPVTIWRRAAWRAALVIALMASVLGLSAGTAGATPPRPAVWFGAPRDQCHWLGSNEAANHWRQPGWGGDWAADICQWQGGAPVWLYAAPQDPNVNIRAYVTRIGNTSCGAGKFVQVELRQGTSYPIGTLTYAHLNLANLSVGQEIGRWGGYLGTVWTNGTASSGQVLPCWGGTPHVHFEALNVANYACYTKEWANSGTMMASNFMGFLGGWFASGRGVRCP